MTKIVPRETLCIKVPKTQGEKTLRLVRKMGFANRDLRIRNDDASIYIPLIRKPNEEENYTLEAQIPDFTLQRKVFGEKTKPKKMLKSVLEDRIKPSLLSKLPRALDIIGDIAIIEIPPELKQQEGLIGKAILESHQKIKTVFAKASAVTGKYRLREFVLIAGEQKTVTFHKEFGCTYKVDVAKAYFSPRLSQEHKRIASLTQKGEIIADLFSGIGPFSILISKTNPDVKVYAVDINPEAIKLLEANVQLNRVENRVLPILGDATKIVEEKLGGVADRVIMNLPENAIEFVEAACKVIKTTGGTVHFYGFVRQPGTLEELQRQFSKKVEGAGRKVERFLCVKTIRETAPYETQVVLDAKIV